MLGTQNILHTSSSSLAFASSIFLKEVKPAFTMVFDNDMPILSSCFDTCLEFSQSLHLKHLVKITLFKSTANFFSWAATKSDNHLAIREPFLKIFTVSCVKAKSCIGMHPSWAWIRLGKHGSLFPFKDYSLSNGRETQDLTWTGYSLGFLSALICTVLWDSVGFTIVADPFDFLFPTIKQWVLIILYFFIKSVSLCLRTLKVFSKELVKYWMRFFWMLYEGHWDTC